MSNYDITAVFENEYGEEYEREWDDVFVNSANAEEEIEQLLVNYGVRFGITLVKFDY